MADVVTIPPHGNMPSFIIKPPGYRRKQRRYNDQEMSVLAPFKNEYLQTKSPAARSTMYRDKILPAMWVQWTSTGRPLDTDERIQLAVSVRFYSKISFAPSDSNAGTADFCAKQLAYQ